MKWFFFWLFVAGIVTQFTTYSLGWSDPVHLFFILSFCLVFLVATLMHLQNENTRMNLEITRNRLMIDRYSEVLNKLIVVMAKNEYTKQEILTKYQIEIKDIEKN